MKQNKKSQSLNKSSEISSYLPRVFGMGELDLTYTLALTTEDIEKYNIDLEKINSANDLDFVIKEKNLWKNIEVSSENFTLDSLFTMTKIAEGEIFAEYTTFGYPTFENKDLESMLDDINGANYLYLNKTNLFNAGYKINFFIDTEEGDSIEIEIYSNKGETKKKKKEGEEGEKNEEDKGEEGKSNSKKENSKNEDNPQQVSLKNSDSPLNNIKLTCEKYEYFFMNIIDATKIEPFSDFIELLMFFKNKMGTNIIMKFSDVSSIFISEEDMLQINRVYFLTDTFFMNTNDALKNFNEHYNYFCKKQKEKKPIDLKTIHEYFINTIACRGQMCLLSPKILFLIDEVFSNLQMVEVGSNGKSLNLNYSVKPYPPISPSNVEKVTEYKYILKNDYPRYEGLFFSGILSQLVFGKDKKPFETLYSSYLVGLEILKKVLEFDFNNIPLPVSRKFYKVKLNQDHVKAMSKKAELEAREGKFVLDCTNLEKSTLRYYVPLFDKDLHEYFQNNEVQRELKNKGFIDTKGFVNYDPIYKSEMIKLKRNKIPKNVIRKALDSDKQIKKKFMENIKEREKKGKRRYMLDTIEPTIVKLPVNDCWAMRSLKEMNKKIGRFKCRHGERRECKFCYLKGLARSAEDIEEFNRKKSQLRRFDS